MSWQLPYNHPKRKLVKTNPLTWIPYFIQWLRTGKGYHNLTPIGELWALGLILLVWLFYISYAWFLYAFRAKMWIGRADQLGDWMRQNYNRYQCDMAYSAETFNEPDAIVTITIRKHPIFIGPEFMRIESPGFRGKILEDKVYYWENRIPDDLTKK
ncbi:hypothetical protein AVT69_gp289 [Pseudomonas phage PhiPA3]|uniref:Uncharacterized protein 291 n=1 Tax=Pseudomonas phage PhiPA3 TaxID=998086 RepID=F8SJC7_BPPA3|nr:hypothetical protein AVT69_gp289 [Pseudomonas phage PhiPA3]AEH03714.1 hypothetical protein [Pseudomonas phage PhiPA3]